MKTQKQNVPAFPANLRSFTYEIHYEAETYV